MNKQTAVTYKIQVKVERPSTTLRRNFTFSTIGPFTCEAKDVSAIVCRECPQADSFEITSSIPARWL